MVLFFRLCGSNLRDIVDLDEALKPRESSVPPETSDILAKPPAHSTRGLDLSSKYTQLLSRNTHEEKTRETQQPEIAALEPEVRSLVYLY